MNIESIIKKTNVNSCIECGKCTGTCPISRFNPVFSPRLQLTTFIQTNPETLVTSDRIWNCLTCGMCSVRCPMNVDFTGFTRQVRLEAQQIGKEPSCSHGGALQSLMHMMTTDNLSQNRLDWVSKELEISEKSDTLFFVGCAPYFDAFFTELEVNTLAAAHASIQLLNRAGIKPALLPNERCCGHDLLWAGEVDAFKKLAEENLAAIKKINPKKIVFACAECYRTFKLDYPEYFGKLDFETVHISEFLADNINKNGIKFKPAQGAVTFHDPCRLGRHLGVYDAPRTVLAQIPGLEIREMPKNRQNAVCCGTSVWINCDAYSKMIQTWRLQMAHDTGSDYMVTSCPKCYIHFSCAMQGEKYPDSAKIPIKDFAVIAAEALAG